ncbi:MAG TPA: zf-HC2 domain-containing protein [Pyrinomonadaceae bacterium]|jgi:anti-sigma factor RsiW|nr:zf-HC2 domain-containing protein [Pyrinomonadaceae bacterium]
MLCNDFEDRLTDYLDGALEPDVHKTFAEHALRCPVCHETLSAVKNTVQACQAANVLEAPKELEARILLNTMPETAMSCQDFEEFLTDYLDGFLPASLYHRWERHAVLCERCTELPGEVVRAIGACYTYIGEEKPLPAGLHERILLATSESLISQQIRAAFGERFAAWMRKWLDPIVSPQLATVATMLLVAVFVLANTVSADGSISGVYSASLRLAEQTSASGSNGGIKEITNGLIELVGGQRETTPPAADKNQGSAQPKEQPKQAATPNRNRQNKQ